MQQVAVANTPSSVNNSGALPANAPSIPFVINLCASTSPVSLTPPDHAGLKRFTFFVSRRREEGRERFRLHMGYFETQEEAEKLLDIVREIYPGAWAGLAPGQRLRAAAAEAASPSAAAGTAPSPRPAPLVVLPQVDTAATSRQRALQLPSVAPTPASAPSAASLTLAPDPLSLVPDAGRLLPQDAQGDADQAAATLTNVRAAIASLDDSAERAARAPQNIPLLKPAVKAASAPSARPALKPVPSARAPVSAPRTSTPVRAASVAHSASMQNDASAGSTVEQPAPFKAAELNNEQALSMLERTGQHALRGPASAARAVPPNASARPASAASLKTPLSETPTNPEQAMYAVQLMWSVQPIEIASVPQLAIFSAYTLYGAEGNRDGRRWYGLRLGFFTDAVSAKQVAHYVRSEFSTVSVVPVTARESERAKIAAARTTAPGGSASASASGSAKPATAPSALKNDFQFIEDKKPQAQKPAAAAKLATRPAPAGRPSRGAPGKRAKLRSANQVNANSKSRPMTLEETLEILGAGQLKMDDGRDATINDSGVRHLRLEALKSGKPSRLGRLLERLSERLGN